MVGPVPILQDNTDGFSTGDVPIYNTKRPYLRVDFGYAKSEFASRWADPHSRLRDEHGVWLVRVLDEITVALLAMVVTKKIDVPRNAAVENEVFSVRHD